MTEVLDKQPKQSNNVRATGLFEGVIDDATSRCSGHGTHCASTISGSTYGVSKEVTVVAVQVLSCGGSGSTSGIMCVACTRPAQPAHTH